MKTIREKLGVDAGSVDKYFKGIEDTIRTEKVQIEKTGNTEKKSLQSSLKKVFRKEEQND